MPAGLASHDENDVALARIDIVVFKYKELIDPVFLKRGGLHNSADRADQTAIKDNILLPSNLLKKGTNVSLLRLPQ
jgi:hypothetical protein